MERLTEKHYLGTDHYMKCSGNCNVDMDCIYCPSFDCLVERLAAYEDTGLEPEEVTALQKRLKRPLHGDRRVWRHRPPAGAGRGRQGRARGGEAVQGWRYGVPHMPFGSGGASRGECGVQGTYQPMVHRHNSESSICFGRIGQDRISHTRRGRKGVDGGEREMNGQACNVCKYCAELKTPYERSDGAAIYGYCFKNGDKDYSPDMGKGYPIFLPLSCGGTCKDFRRRRGLSHD